MMEYYYDKSDQEKLFDVPEEVTEVEVEDGDINELAVVSGMVVGCGKLNIRENPDKTAPIVCSVLMNTEVIVDLDESTDDFYKVVVPAGFEGYCVKEFIRIDS